jgi:hypothetical protein
MNEETEYRDKLLHEMNYMWFPISDMRTFRDGN